MKITNKTKAYWLASETAQGVKVWFMYSGQSNKGKVELGSYRDSLTFATLDEVKKFCKGQIVFTSRKIITSRKVIVSK
jgi:hypothetical protein